MRETDGFVCAGRVGYTHLNLAIGPIPDGRARHQYGEGPFARLTMPPLPNAPGVYLWQVEETVVYVGQTRTPLRKRLGPNGYSSITAYNTLARELGKRNGGQQTNCRLNALANKDLVAGRNLTIWYRLTEDGAAEEAKWMSTFGMPIWNRRLERGLQLSAALDSYEETSAAE